MGKLTPIALTAFAAGIYFFLTYDSFDPQTISGQRVVVTGASSGIGEQLAYEYSKLGARLLITARRNELLNEVAKKCLQLGAAQVEVVVSDVAKVDDRDKLIAEIEKRLGGLDYLILNHAYVRLGWFIENQENFTDFLKHVEVNYVSMVDLAWKSMKMLTESRGRIGVVSSISGKVPSPGFSSYTGTKYALSGFFESWNQELAIRNTGVSITIAIVGPVNTALGDISAEKKLKLCAKHLYFVDFMLEPQNTALDILKGVATRQIQVYSGMATYLMMAVHRSFSFLWWKLINAFATDLVGLASSPNYQI